MIDPEVIGIHAEYDDDGGLTLSPTFDGVGVGDTESRWGQLNLEDAEALRVKNQLILLKEEALEAISEVLTSRYISRSQVEAFIKAPTAFVSSAMIDLDTGFSLRVHGAERFELRYFGDTEAISQDWFEGDSKPEMPLERKLALVTSEAELVDLEEKVQHALKRGASVVEFEDYKVVFDPQDFPAKAIEEAREN